MGTKSCALVVIGVFLLSSSSYAWDNLRPVNPPAGEAPPQSHSSPPLTPSPPGAIVGQGTIPNNQAMPSDASGWPMYPYPDHHNPFYNGNSPRDLFSGTVEWIVGLPSTVMGSLSNFLDRKVFPQTPATHGAKSPNPNSVQPLYVSPEKPSALPPAVPYVKDDEKGR